jgi:hypothetical protein
MSSRATRAKVKLLVEYVTVTLPVAVYISLEEFQQNQWAHFVHSPEWSIATIFLSIQAIRLFRDSLTSSSGGNLILCKSDGSNVEGFFVRIRRAQRDIHPVPIPAAGGEYATSKCMVEKISALGTS